MVTIENKLMNLKKSFILLLYSYIELYSLDSFELFIIDGDILQ